MLKFRYLVNLYQTFQKIDQVLGAVSVREQDFLSVFLDSFGTLISSY